MNRLRRAALQGGLGQRREDQGEADADQDLRWDRERNLRLRQQRQPAEAAGDEDRPGRGAGAARNRRLETGAEESGERHHRDHDRRPDRGQSPALDQQQHQQEQGGGDRRRDHRQGDVGEHVRAAGPRSTDSIAPVAASCRATARIGIPARSATGTCSRKIDCQETSLGQQSTDAAGPSAAPSHRRSPRSRRPPIDPTEAEGSSSSDRSDHRAPPAPARSGPRSGRAIPSVEARRRAPRSAKIASPTRRPTRGRAERGRGVSGGHGGQIAITRLERDQDPGHRATLRRR